MDDFLVFVYQLCFNFGPANRLLAQIGAKNSAAETRACFPLEFFFAPFSIN